MVVSPANGNNFRKTILSHNISTLHLGQDSFGLPPSSALSGNNGRFSGNNGMIKYMERIHGQHKFTPDVTSNPRFELYML